MEFKRDLLKRDRKQKFQIFFGIFALLFAFFIIVYSFFDQQSFTVFGCIQITMYFILGINASMEGIGISPARLFGKAYVDIDEEHIAIKHTIFAKEQQVAWNDIKSIDYNYH